MRTPGTHGSGLSGIPRESCPAPCNRVHRSGPSLADQLKADSAAIYYRFFSGGFKKKNPGQQIWACVPLASIDDAAAPTQPVSRQLAVWSLHTAELILLWSAVTHLDVDDSIVGFEVAAHRQFIEATALIPPISKQLTSSWHARSELAMMSGGWASAICALLAVVTCCLWNSRELGSIMSGFLVRSNKVLHPTNDGRVKLLLLSNLLLL